MSNNLFSDLVSVVKMNGERFDDVEAVVDAEKILIHDGTLPIVEGDKILRILPNGISETYLILHSQYWSTPDSSSMQDYYELDVQKENVIDRAKPSQQIIGTLIQGNMSGGNVQSVGFSNAPISQIVNDAELLLTEVNKAIDGINTVVKSELDGSELIDYIKLSDQLRDYIVNTSNPEPNRIKKLLTGLTFLDTANGSIELIYKIWPYIHVLVAISSELINRFPK